MSEIKSWDERYDLIVVGAGTGLMGAITAALGYVLGLGTDPGLKLVRR